MATRTEPFVMGSGGGCEYTDQDFDGSCSFQILF